jgi:ribosomal-protein-alanine N-acetyltransferase
VTEIRRLTYADLPQVVAIERRAFPAPWSLALFVLELSKAAGVCLAATREDQLCGYLVCSRYADVWHLMNVAVAPEARRQRIARALMDELLAKLPPKAQVTLEVRRSNEAALKMYEAYDFCAAGVRPRYYQDNGEDALIMWRTPGTLRGTLDDVPNADPRAALR